MDKRYNVYYPLSSDFDSDVECIFSKMKQYSGLDLILTKEYKSYFHITPPTRVPHGITLSFTRKGVYGDGTMVIERDSIEIESDTPEMNYVEGVALAVLLDLRGEIDIELPAWSRTQWQGEGWWKKVGHQRGLLERLVQKMLFGRRILE